MADQPGAARNALPVSTWRLGEVKIAQRELEIVGKMLNWPGEQLYVRGLSNDVGPGNALTLTVEHEAVTEVFTGFGEKGVSAEHVAKSAAERARAYLAARVRCW